MFSPEFMRFLINYQTPEYKEEKSKHVKYFRFSLKDRFLAYSTLFNKK